ncbi:MAG: hypothetical protein MO846_11615 [Candidatus Devosia symbiotica]|nr:hypothetical protein [Candidatus Devosia symbiotica]
MRWREDEDVGSEYVEEFDIDFTSMMVNPDCDDAAADAVAMTLDAGDTSVDDAFDAAPIQYRIGPLESQVPAASCPHMRGSMIRCCCSV